MERIQKIFLSPFSLIYGFIVCLRNKLFDWNILHSTEFDIPVICVGNLTVGGTGKTPHVEYLVELLKDEFKIAVLSRGYKRKTRGFQLTHENGDPSDYGDESCQVKNKFPDIIVAVDEKRSRGIKNLLGLKEKPDLILLDDAFQHRYVRAGLNILLMDYSRPVKKDMLLPAGRLREPLSSKKRAQIILITKSPENLKAIDRRLIAREMDLDDFQHLFFTIIKPARLKPLFKGEVIDINENKNPVVLVSGIASPGQFRSSFQNLSQIKTEIEYPDHYNYTAKDVVKIKSELEKLGNFSILVCTEKDAVKLRTLDHEFENLKNKMFYLPIGIDFLNEDADNFNKQILRYVRDNKGNSILHKGKN